MTHPDTLQRAAFEAWYDSGSENRDEFMALVDAALQAQAAEGHAFNDESPFCVKCGSTGDDSVAPVAHILPRMLKILKFKSMPVPVDPLPYDNGEEKTVPLYLGPQPAALQAQPTPPVGQAAAEPVASIYIDNNGEREFDDWKVDLPKGRNVLYTTPQPTPDAEAMRLALEALKLIKDWGECALAVEKRDAAIAALEKVTKS